MESSCRRRKTWRRMEQEKVVRKVIWPAIRGRSCPICFRNLEVHYRAAAVLTACRHAYCIECIRKWSKLRRKCPLCNAEFNSWFCKLSLSSREFQKEVLPFHDLRTNSNEEIGTEQIDSRRILARTRAALNDRRTRALPRRRSFGRPGLVSPEIMAHRKLEWRASIYSRGIQAVPSTSSCPEQDRLRNNAEKEKLLERIKPWIRRELQTILSDPDPSVIVHVATSQYIAWLEEKAKSPSQQLDVQDSFMSPLCRFLHDKTSIFWHELRCFAESSYNMETYDAVVEYEQLQ
ncbi:hypothetical protein L6164_012580 [Bauhinia variegata]|uniref:Uncharacterized protein n=1 Tax=Bauhinia variegata TaxID=167791 RepID=A0ACB9PAU6_BAUVA|nr:hypothetical protein L6164_012580 [Bauhinia variegata]